MNIPFLILFSNSLQISTELYDHYTLIYSFLQLFIFTSLCMLNSYVVTYSYQYDIDINFFISSIEDFIFY